MLPLSGGDSEWLSGFRVSPFPVFSFELLKPVPSGLVYFRCGVILPMPEAVAALWFYSTGFNSNLVQDHLYVKFKK